MPDAPLPTTTPEPRDEKRAPGRPWPKGSTAAAAAPWSPPFSPVPRSAIHDDVYAQLRRAIIHSLLPPGDWLRQDDLASQFGVSRMPIREALGRLGQEGLVEIVPNHGARVAPLSVEDFEELYAERKGVEGFAARISAERVEKELLNELRGRLAQLVERSRPRDAGELATYLAEEWQVRRLVYTACGRARLQAHVQTLRDYAERYLRLAYTVDGQTIEGRPRESFEYHRQLLAACERRDGPAAEHIVQAALDWTLINAGPVVADRLNGD